MNNVDYQALCKELFGTDDVKALRKIAQTAGTHNPRNAGRKKKFTTADARQMMELLGKGYTVNEIAARFQTSRQVISKYINMPPSEKFPLRITCMYKQHPTTIICVDFINERIKIQNRTPDVLHRAFGVIEAPTWEDFNYFLKERCFPATRGNVKQLLRQMQIGGYDPLQIAEKTAGRMAADNLWLKFDYYKGVAKRGTNIVVRQ